jgi:hypothetical protein
MKRCGGYLTAAEFEEALANCAHTLAGAETAVGRFGERILFIHLHLSDGRNLTISSVSGAGLAIEER